MDTTWTTTEALEVCRIIESVAPNYGCHVALTGGLLYKDGNRKDCDIVLYRIRQAPLIDMQGLLDALKPLGVTMLSGFGFCYKCMWKRKLLDFLVPEESGSEYPAEEELLTLTEA
jgi:hypothetical protein